MPREGFYESLGLPRFINARAFATAHGGCVLSAEVTKAMTAASREYVEMKDLGRIAGELIAKLTGAEDGLVTAGAAAGIAVGTAALLTGTDIIKIEQLPDTRGFQRRKVIVQRAHENKYINMIRLAGAEVVPFGYINGPGWTTKEQLESLIDEATAGMYFVSSFHKHAKGELPLPSVLEVSKRRGVPVLVDAAYERDLKKFVGMGADLVTYSGGKWLGAPGGTGILCGRRDLIEAARSQEWGIGRPMKVSKEEIAGLIAALRSYSTQDWAAFDSSMREKLDSISEGLRAIPGITLRKSYEDDTGGPAYLLEIEIDPQIVQRTAAQVNEALLRGQPRIYVREYFTFKGMLQIDVSPLLPGDAEILIRRLRAELRPILVPQGRV